MDQELLVQPSLFKLKEEEESLLNLLQDNYFFDMNLMMLPETLDKISQTFQITVEITSALQYQQERKKLLFNLLKYDIGLDILIKLIYKRDQSPLHGYYYLKTLEDLSNILWEMQNELLDYAIQEDIVEIKIAYRINKLFYSILNRKQKERKIISKVMSDQVEKDIQQLKIQQGKIQDVYCFLSHYRHYYQCYEQIFELLNKETSYLLKKVILFKNENNTILNEMATLEHALQLMSNLTIYQQELILTYLQQTLELNDLDIRKQFANLYQAIYYMDDLKKENFQINFREVVKKSMYFYFDIENWKLLIIERLIEMNQQQDAYELLLASKIDWSTSENSDIIINLLITSKRILQAYTYATEMKDECIFRYFIIQMIKNNEIEDLLKIDFTTEQDKLVNEIIKNLQDEQILIQFAKKLLRTKKYYQAIEFHQMINQTSLGIGKQKIEELIRQRISQLSAVEERFYLAKLDQQNQVDDDFELIESILNQPIGLGEKSIENEKKFTFFVQQPKIENKRIINCCGWIRENLIGTSF